jgi:hypothetical protein
MLEIVEALSELLTKLPIVLNDCGLSQNHFIRMQQMANLIVSRTIKSLIKPELQSQCSESINTLVSLAKKVLDDIQKKDIKNLIVDGMALV